MKLSIMFITRNRKSELLRAIDSCLLNRIEDMEFIIVDNGSDDGTQESVEIYLKESNASYKYFYSNVNLGVAGGRNKAFSLATGEYVFSLDDDAVIETKDFFRKILKNMDNEYKVVAAAVEVYEPLSKNYLKGKTYKSNACSYDGTKVFSFIGCAHILRREFYLKRKLYPNNLQFGSEELYPSLMAHRENKVIAYYEDLRILHMPSEIFRVHGEERDFNFTINTHIIRKLCYPILVMPLLNITFYMRLKKHNFLKYKSREEIKNIYSQRYNKEEIVRMSFIRFLNLIKNVGFFDLI